MLKHQLGQLPVAERQIAGTHYAWAQQSPSLLYLYSRSAQTQQELAVMLHTGQALGHQRNVVLNEQDGYKSTQRLWGVNAFISLLEQALCLLFIDASMAQSKEKFQCTAAFLDTSSLWKDSVSPARISTHASSCTDKDLKHSRCRH